MIMAIKDLKAVDDWRARAVNVKDISRTRLFQHRPRVGKRQSNPKRVLLFLYIG